MFITTAEPFGDALPPKYSKAPGSHDNVPVTHRHKFSILAVNRRDKLRRQTRRRAVPHMHAILVEQKNRTDHAGRLRFDQPDQGCERVR